MPTQCKKWTPWSDAQHHIKSIFIPISILSFLYKNSYWIFKIIIIDIFFMCDECDHDVVQVLIYFFDILCFNNFWGSHLYSSFIELCSSRQFLSTINIGIMWFCKSCFQFCQLFLFTMENKKKIEFQSFEYFFMFVACIPE